MLFLDIENIINESKILKAEGGVKPRILQVFGEEIPQIPDFRRLSGLANVLIDIYHNKTFKAMIVVLFIVSQVVALGCVSAYGIHLEREEQRNYRNNLMTQRQGKKNHNALRN